MLRTIVAFLILGTLGVFSPAWAEQEPAAPKPESYLCPDAFGGRAVDCFLNAVEHLYTMCRQVKSIEIIEFGYEKSDEGVNGAKSTYCVDKHKGTMYRLYQAALREAGGNRAATEGLHTLHDMWLKSLQDLKWRQGESDSQYKTRIAGPYDVFHEKAAAVRTAMTSTAKPKPPAPAKAKGKTAT